MANKKIAISGLIGKKCYLAKLFIQNGWQKKYQNGWQKKIKKLISYLEYKWSTLRSTS